MKILDILTPEAIVPEMQAGSKTTAIEELASLVASLHPAIDRARLVEVLCDREELGSTAIGEGIAIPHGKLPTVSGVIAAFGRSLRGVDFDSLDGRPTHLFFLLVAPEESAGIHLKALARVSRLLKEQSFRARLLASPTREEIFTAFREEDDKY